MDEYHLPKEDFEGKIKFFLCCGEFFLPFLVFDLLK